MKLSPQMRMNLDMTPDADEGDVADSIFYHSQLEPLARRGLLTFKTVTVMRPVRRFHVQLTDLGRRVKRQNSDD